MPQGHAPACTTAPRPPSHMGPCQPLTDAIPPAHAPLIVCQVPPRPCPYLSLLVSVLLRGPDGAAQAAGQQPGVGPLYSPGLGGPRGGGVGLGQACLRALSRRAPVGQLPVDLRIRILPAAPQVRCLWIGMSGAGRP